MYYQPLLYAFLFLLTSCVKESTEEEPEPEFKYMPYISDFSINNTLYYIVGDSVHIQIEAGDMDGEVKSVWFYLDGKLWVVDDAPPWKQSMIFPDRHSIVIAVFAMDNEGIISEVSIVELFSKELSPPRVLLLFDYNQFSEDSTVNIDFYSSSSDANIIKCEVFLNDTLWLVKNQPYFRFTIDSIRTGIHRVWGRVEDSRSQIAVSDTIVFVIPENTLNGSPCLP